MSAELPLQGKVAVITGASSGIGKAAAVSWAALGADIVAAARSDRPRDDGYPSLVDTRAEVEALGRRCVTVRVDVSVDDDVAELHRRTMDELGRVDIVLNNAAAMESGAMNAGFLAMTPDQWRYQIAVNLTGPWLVAKAFVPEMLGRGGLVVNMTSGPIPGDPPIVVKPGMGFPGAAYPTSKAGINRLSAVLANELREHGITVIAFHPGRTLVERSVEALTAGGYDLDQWLGIEHPIGELERIVTHDDPMSLTGTVVYAPQPRP